MRRFEFCGCLYDGHWRLILSLTSGPVNNGSSQEEGIIFQASVAAFYFFYVVCL